MSEYYYSENGQRIGPIAEDAMLQLVANKKISGSTLCWTESFGPDWKKLSQTTFWTPLGGPPPLPAEAVNNFYAYLFAFVPLIGSVIEAVGAQFYPDLTRNLLAVFIFYFAFYSVVAGLDIRQIAKSSTPEVKRFRSFWILPPVYLWFRARRLEQKPIYFWLWFVALVLSIFIA